MHRCQIWPRRTFDRERAISCLRRHRPDDVGLNDGKVLSEGGCGSTGACMGAGTTYGSQLVKGDAKGEFADNCSLLYSVSPTRSNNYSAPPPACNAIDQRLDRFSVWNVLGRALVVFVVI